MLGKPKILISEHLDLLCQRCCESFGADCEVVTVERCTDKVITAIKEHLPQIALLETDDSLCDAVEIINHVRKCNDDKLPVFILITHSFREECRVRAVSPDYIFLKPIDWVYMANRIHKESIPQIV